MTSTATIVTLTNYNANPVRSLADVQLYSVSRVGEYEVPQIVSSTSQQFVVDLLFSQLVRRSARARELYEDLTPAPTAEELELLELPSRA